MYVCMYVCTMYDREPIASLDLLLLVNLDLVFQRLKLCICSDIDIAVLLKTLNNR